MTATRSRLETGRRLVLILAATLAAGCGGGGSGGEEGPPKFPPDPVFAKGFGAPKLPEHLVFRPTIETTEETFTAGSAFAVTLEGEERPILLTAVHILGDLAERNDTDPPKDLRKAIKKVTLTDCFDNTYTVDAGADILPIDARPFAGDHFDSKGGLAGDILAIRLPKEAKLATLKLSQGCPPQGEAIYIVAQILEGADINQRIHEARVSGEPKNPRGVYNFDFQESTISIDGIRGTSGAPIVNSDGHVIAIDLGYGISNPVTRFGYYLRKAAKASASK